MYGRPSLKGRGTASEDRSTAEAPRVYNLEAPVDQAHNLLSRYFPAMKFLGAIIVFTVQGVAAWRLDDSQRGLCECAAEALQRDSATEPQRCTVRRCSLGARQTLYPGFSCHSIEHSATLTCTLAGSRYSHCLVLKH